MAEKKVFILENCPNHTFLGIKTPEDIVILSGKPICFSLERHLSKNIENANFFEKNISESIICLKNTDNEFLVRSVSFSHEIIFIERHVFVDWDNLGPLVCDILEKYFTKDEIEITFQFNGLPFFFK
ncbi:MAG: hypothetical protein WCI41_01735 [bacterium]